MLTRAHTSDKLLSYDFRSAVGARCLLNICNVERGEKARRNSVLTQSLGVLNSLHELPGHYFSFEGGNVRMRLAVTLPYCTSPPSFLSPSFSSFLFPFPLFSPLVSTPFLSYSCLLSLFSFFLFVGVFRGGAWFPPTVSVPGWVGVI